MLTVYLLGGSIAVLVLVVVVIAFVVRRVRRAQRRKALEQIVERYQAGQALVRYVMIHRQCSEEVAYQRIAAFVKKHAPMDDHSLIERMLADDRQSLLESARRIFVRDPNGIDKI